MTQSGSTQTLLLDPERRPRIRQVAGHADETVHYSDDTDTPSWEAFGTSWRRYIGGIGSSLAAIQDYSSATTLLQLGNLHGDVVATASLSASATGPIDTFESTEFGVPRQQDQRRYSWLGAKQRATALPTGIVEMGVRLYVPQLGRFLQVDPVLGGSANDYDYAGQDPVNTFDLDGRCPVCVVPVAIGAEEIIAGVVIAGGGAVVIHKATEHRKPRPSTEQKHEEGISRKQRDEARAESNRRKGQKGGKGTTKKQAKKQKAKQQKKKKKTTFPGCRC